MKQVILLGSLCILPILGQTNVTSGGMPTYHVTVVERTAKAINYAYRSEPTRIGFHGTVLLPTTGGQAFVISKPGHTEIDARFNNLLPPQRFGREYLSYVLWAISPDGNPQNLGEIVPDASNRAKLRVTTQLQAFALVVTAEPYSAVRQPSDVVVMENQVLRDTVGKIEEVNAHYELLPRGHYTWHVPDALESQLNNAPKVSMREYEAQLEIYQAQNAIGIAAAAGAGQYAPNTLAKANQLLADARQMEGLGNDTSGVVESAREAAQTAEDARLIGERRRREVELANARAELSTAQSQVVEAHRAQAEAQHAQAQADAAAERARADAKAAWAQADAERTARQQAETDAATARSVAQAKLVPSAPPRQLELDTAAQSALRMQLIEELNGVSTARDTPRGLVVTIPDSGFRSGTLRGTASAQVARVGAILAMHPGLYVAVEGYTNSAADPVLSDTRSQAVRNALLTHGLAPGVVIARGLGNLRPLASEATEGGRLENSRVEIVITGDPIGNYAFWDHPYTITQR